LEKNQKMIIAKPKFNTLFSIAVFEILMFSLVGWAAWDALSTRTMEWYHFLGIVVVAPLALGVGFKTLLGYKVVTISKERINVRFPVRFTEKTYSLKEVKSWKETSIKTFSGPYRELEIHFTPKGKLVLSVQEHTHYPKVVKYLEKKCAKAKAE
jgi:hypothetical protein